MTERVDQHPVSSTVGLVGRLALSSRSGRDRTLVDGIDVTDLQVQRAARAAEGVRRQDAQVGCFVREVEHGEGS